MSDISTNKNYTLYYCYMLMNLGWRLGLVSCILFRMPGWVLTLLMLLWICSAVNRQRTEERFPEKFKKFVRPSRLLYECIMMSIIVLEIMTPSFMMSHFPNHVVATTRIAMIVELSLYFFIDWQNYKWRTAHKSKV